MSGFLKRVETFLERVDEGVGASLSSTSTAASEPVDERQVFAFLSSADGGGESNGEQQQPQSAAAATTRDENALLRAEVVRQAKEIAALRQRQRSAEIDAAAAEELLSGLRAAADAAIAERARAEDAAAAERAARADAERAARERMAQVEADIGVYSAALADARARLQQLSAEREKPPPPLPPTTVAAVVATSDAETQTPEEEKGEDETATAKPVAEADAEKARAAAALSEEAGQLRRKLEGTLGRCEELEKQAALLRGAVKEARETAANAARECAEQRVELGKLRAETLVLRGRAAEAEAGSERLRRQLAAKSVLGAEHAQLEARVRTLSESLASVQRRLEDAVRENERLRAASGAPASPAILPATPLSHKPMLSSSLEHEQLPSSLAGSLASLLPVRARWIGENVDSAVDFALQHIVDSPRIRMGALGYVLLLHAWALICLLRTLTS